MPSENANRFPSGLKVTPRPRLKNPRILQYIAGVHVPDLHGRIVTGGDQPFSIRAEGQALRCIRMTGQL